MHPVDPPALAKAIEAFFASHTLTNIERDGNSFLLIPKHHAFRRYKRAITRKLKIGFAQQSAGQFYEEATTLLISYLIGEFMPRDVIDAGAGVGYFSRVASSRVIDAPRVYGFEMREDRFSRFEVEIANDGFKHLITPVHAGLTAKHVGPIKVWWARSQLFEHEPSAAEYQEPWLLRALHYLRGNRNRGLKSSSILLTSIDHYCMREQVEPGLIKIDVEGHEGKVLDGASEVLTNYRPVVVLELHRDSVQHDGETRLSVVQRLFDHGYKALFLTDHHNRQACRVVVADIDNPLFRRRETDLILFVPG